MKKLILLILVLIFLFTGCGSYKVDVKENIKVSASPKEVFIFAGKIQANNSVNLASKLNPPAKVSKVNVEVGNTVNAGDPIIYLDTTELEKQKNQADAKVGTQKAILDKTLNSTRKEDIAIAENSVQNDEAALKNCENNYNRIKELYDKGYETKANMEATELALTNIKNKLATDKETLAKYTNGSTSQDVNVALGGINEAEAAASYYESQVKNGIIVSPISGTVSACSIHTGEVASTGVALVTIVNNDSLYIDGYIPEDMLSQVKVGQEVIVKVSSIEAKRFKGEITVINPVENSNNKNIVRVTLKDGKDLLKPGMVAQIGFIK